MIQIQPIDLSIAEIGDRVTFLIPERGGWSHGFGDIQKINRVTIRVVDAKFDDGTIFVVDKKLITKLIKTKDLIKLVLVKE